MRSYGEVIDVRTTQTTRTAARPGSRSSTPGAPEQFLWRGRIYLVRDVLAHWVELGAWWAAPGRPTLSDVAAAAGADRSGDEPPVRSIAADVGAVEHEVWRVEAAPGRSANPGVYDLVRDVPAGCDVGSAPDDLEAPGRRPGGHRPDVPQRWRLARALD